MRPQGRLSDLASIRKANYTLLSDIRKHLLDRIDQPSDRRQDVLRLFEKVQIAPSGCWEWTDTSRDGKGYGMFFYEGRSHRAHRVVARWLVGRPLTHDENVLHTCDNPPCCNPFHLFLGTHADNMADMRSKSRGRTSPGREGEGNPYAKLTWDQVREIRRRYTDGSGVLQRELAEEYGVQRPAISNIVNYKVWKEEADGPDAG